MAVRGFFSSARFVRPPVDKTKNPEFWKEWDAKIDALSAKRESKKPENWPAGKQLAILRIERSAFALDIIRHLEGSKSTIRAAQQDFAELRIHGFAVRPLSERYHSLTPAGVRAAEQVAIAMAKMLGLHHIRFRHDSWNHHVVSCTCGWHTTGDRTMNRSWRSSLGASANRHLESIKATGAVHG